MPPNRVNLLEKTGIGSIIGVKGGRIDNIGSMPSCFTKIMAGRTFSCRRELPRAPDEVKIAGLDSADVMLYKYPKYLTHA